MQTQPVVVDGVLYGYTPTHKAFALKADTGARAVDVRFRNPRQRSEPRRDVLERAASRAESAKPSRSAWGWGPTRNQYRLRRVGTFIYALDAATGKPIPTFGMDGRIDLRENLGRDPQTQAGRLTSPGVIYKDLMIVGGRVGESLPDVARRHSRVRRAHRRAAVVVPHDSASRRVRVRDLAERRVAVQRRRQQLARHGAR